MNTSLFRQPLTVRDLLPRATRPDTTPDDRSQTRSFHRFPNLPPELQEMIWRHAIRPFCQGVHFFTVYDIETFPQDMTSVSVAAHRSDPTRTGLALAAPRAVDRSFDWMSGNPSMYLWDRGLWTACQESRYLMYRVYEHSGKWPPRQLYERPRADVINMEWGFLHTKAKGVGLAGNFFKLPISDLDLKPGELRFGCEMKIAMEYKPYWNIFHIPVSVTLMANERTERGFFVRLLYSQVFHPNHVSKIWLIDHTLRRKRPASQGTTTPEKFRGEVFYDMDKRFVQVTREDCEWDDDTPDTTSAFCFVETLKRR
ncbi:hypothetical protein PT974_01849 [Cladobotryum mycophilum]|uniref:2EXR domain-containing protein n=1 Tax=Cladobotryum mycophilum TaxID=491253 RepID=A0ABR0SWX0_9HYPO